MKRRVERALLSQVSVQGGSNLLGDRRIAPTPPLFLAAQHAVVLRRCLGHLGPSLLSRWLVIAADGLSSSVTVSPCMRVEFSTKHFLSAVQ